MAEMGFLAGVFHWPLASLLDLEHPDRRRFIDLVSVSVDDRSASTGWVE